MSDTFLHLYHSQLSEWVIHENPTSRRWRALEKVAKKHNLHATTKRINLIEEDS
jgi:hypothetical protein